MPSFLYLSDTADVELAQEHRSEYVNKVINVLYAPRPKLLVENRQCSRMGNGYRMRKRTNQFPSLDIHLKK